MRRMVEKLESVVSEESAASEKDESESLFSQWKQGWRFIQSSRTVLSTIWFGCFGLMAILMIDYQFTTLFPGDQAR
ncbi:hypothetical protein Q0F98_14535 [Paenibacillus amylolyticus]|nr:hypothetical protein Q0F98_14535 [Paenibacillus amylolyticus]